MGQDRGQRNFLKRALAAFRQLRRWARPRVAAWPIAGGRSGWRSLGPVTHGKRALKQIQRFVDWGAL
jgi:hypothetical protein